ncbi:hypothetical protein ERX55_09475 [Macrococcus bovicus]|uniref:Uncharacterized protein n=1 Tax=Macrococcus bovicus TaxID=69968 RepID=A0A4R6BXX6_9STAP|nr:hypothetical protein ERX55_09475 [Macrococcus bovicus]
MYRPADPVCGTLLTGCAAVSPCIVPQILFAGRCFTGCAAVSLGIVPQILFAGRCLQDALRIHWVSSRRCRLRDVAQAIALSIPFFLKKRQKKYRVCIHGIFNKGDGRNFHSNKGVCLVCDKFHIGNIS